MSSVIVADAGPLHYLVLIDCAEILGRLFDRVLVPTTVRDELSSKGTPEKVKQWILQSPSWLEIQTVATAEPIRGLHPGEVEALRLALTLQAGVLMDELSGRKAARLLGVKVVGTLGVIERAAEKELIKLPEAVAKLRCTNFFISPELLDEALERDRLRREKIKRD